MFVKNNDDIKGSLKIFGAIFGAVGILAVIDKVIEKSGIYETSKSPEENKKRHERKYR